MRAIKGAAETIRGTMAPFTPIFVPTMSLVKGMMATIRMIKGKRAAHIDDPAENLVDSPIGPDAVGLGDGENHAQRQADEIRKDGGNAGHDQRIPCAFQKIAAVFSPEHGNGIKHGIPPPQR